MEDENDQVYDGEKYHELVDLLQRASRLASALSLLQWDEQVNLPSGVESQKSRAAECEELSVLVHKAATDPKIGDALDFLDALREGKLTLRQEVVVREARREYDRQLKLPEEFVARKTHKLSIAYHSWAEAKEKSDFSSFAPVLKQVIDLSIEEASYLGYDRASAYSYHLDQFDAGTDLKHIERAFARMRRELVPLVRSVLDSERTRKATETDPFGKESTPVFPIHLQKQFAHEVVERLGFDFTRGRMDVSLHPFTTGHSADTRLTTNYDEKDPWKGVFSAIHEAGHGLYEQGLPLLHMGTPLAERVGMTVDESQSRIYENFVARSGAFWEFWEDRFRELFPSQLARVTKEQLQQSVKRVEMNPIRVDADELTYNLHILIRFELEKRLFAGTLSVDELPAEWAKLSEEILGITPKTDSEGVLQDVHWAAGLFGYFPSYALGNMFAAQLWETALADLPDLENDFRVGDYSKFLAFLREKVHTFGKLHGTFSLVKQSTGKKLKCDALLRHLKSRYQS